MVNFEIKERGGLMFKKELGGRVWLFKERVLLWSEKKVVGCTKYSSSAFFLMDIITLRWREFLRSNNKSNKELNTLDYI